MPMTKIVYLGPWIKCPWQKSNILNFVRDTEIPWHLWETIFFSRLRSDPLSYRVCVRMIFLLVTTFFFNVRDLFFHMSSIASETPRDIFEKNYMWHFSNKVPASTYNSLMGRRKIIKKLCQTSSVKLLIHNPMSVCEPLIVKKVVPCESRNTN